MAGGRARDGEGDETKVVPRGNRPTGEMPCPLGGASWSGPNGRPVAEPVAWGLAAAVRDARWLERLKPGAGASSGGP
jgi:hypothetical protein